MLQLTCWGMVTTMMKKDVVTFDLLCNGGNSDKEGYCYIHLKCCAMVVTMIKKDVVTFDLLCNGGNNDKEGCCYI